MDYGASAAWLYKGQLRLHRNWSHKIYYYLPKQSSSVRKNLRLPGNRVLWICGTANVAHQHLKSVEQQQISVQSAIQSRHVHNCHKDTHAETMTKTASKSQHGFLSQ